MKQSFMKYFKLRHSSTIVVCCARSYAFWNHKLFNSLCTKMDAVPFSHGTQDEAKISKISWHCHTAPLPFPGSLHCPKCEVQLRHQESTTLMCFISESNN